MCKLGKSCSVSHDYVARGMSYKGMGEGQYDIAGPYGAGYSKPIVVCWQTACPRGPAIIGWWPIVMPQQ